MGKNRRLTVSELKRAVGPDFKRLLQESAEVLNSARDRASGPFGPDPLIKSQRHGVCNSLDDKDLDAAANSLSAHLQRAGKRPENAPVMLPDLAQVVATWHHLPEAVKTGILAMVKATTATPGSP